METMDNTDVEGNPKVNKLPQEYNICTAQLIFFENISFYILESTLSQATGILGVGLGMTVINNAFLI